MLFINIFLKRQLLECNDYVVLVTHVTEHTTIDMY